MIASLQTLLDGIIDYAGLFPPAKLDMQAALRQFVAARQPQLVTNWMVRTFVCGADRLGELENHFADDFTSDDPVNLSVVLPKSPDLAATLPHLENDLEALSSFARRRPETAAISNLELALPDAAFASRGTLDGLLDEVVERIAKQRWVQNGDGGPTLFVEIPTGGDWIERIGFVVDLLARRDTDDDRAMSFGLKARTGGLEASAFPSVDFLAATMNACHSAGICWKATAGLHHPFRRRDEQLGVDMHGFLNVAVADALGFASKADEATLRAVLDDRDVANFAFEEKSIRWRDRRVSINDIADARWSSFVSFGSCSYEEPVADLTALRLA